MNKICTDINQSMKLIELGLDVNTSDMYYPNRTDIQYQGALPIGMKHGNSLLAQEIPAWSLTALLKLIKSEIYGETIYGDTITYKVKFRKYKFTVDLYQIAYGNYKNYEDGSSSWKDMINTGQKEDPIDAAFQMVCWLKENGKL